MNRGTVTEYIHIDLNYCNLESCISNLTTHFNDVPEDCRQSARFEVGYGEEYGSAYARQYIKYERPETDKEFNKRVKQHNDWQARRIADAKKVLGIKND